VVRLYRYEGDSTAKAFVDVAIGDYIVKGFKVVEGEKGLFVSMPREKSKQGKWFDCFYTVTPEAKQRLVDTVMTAYREQK